MSLGLGNYLYDLKVENGTAKFDFRDPDDADNTAEVSVDEKDFGGFNADSRQVAEVAFAQCSKTLNDKRDSRLKREAAAHLDKDLNEKARSREAGEDFLNNASDVATEPAKVEDDGTKVYNTGKPSDDSNSDSDNGSNKKSK